MIWVYGYTAGVFISAIIAGFLTRGSHLKDEDYQAAVWGSLLWPLVLAVIVIATPFLILFGFPWLVFALTRGELDEPIADAIKWCKTTWKNIGD